MVLLATFFPLPFRLQTIYVCFSTRSFSLEILSIVSHPLYRAIRARLTRLYFRSSRELRTRRTVSRAEVPSGSKRPICNFPNVSFSVVAPVHHVYRISEHIFDIFHNFRYGRVQISDNPPIVFLCSFIRLGDDKGRILRSGFKVRDDITIEGSTGSFQFLRCTILYRSVIITIFVFEFLERRQKRRQQSMRNVLNE